MASISFQYRELYYRPVPYLMRSKFARCLQTSSMLSHDSLLGLDESSVKSALNLNALSVHVRVVGAVSICVDSLTVGLLSVDESAAFRQKVGSLISCVA